MKKMKIIAIVAASLLVLHANAQSDVDALRYSSVGFGGTARYTAMSGAFGAIGADFSTLSTNPAGLGVFRTGVFVLTPAIYAGKTAAKYNDNRMEDLKYNFNCSNVGIVFSTYSNKNPDKEGWKAVNFGFGMNRTNNFHNRMLVEGSSTGSSIIDSYLANAKGLSPEDLGDFDTRLAFDTYLIDTIGGDYYSNVPSNDLLQRKTLETRGSMQEMVFSLAGNYNNRFFVGATIGIPNIRYIQESTYKEMDNANSDSIFNSLTINDYLSTSGTGINLKLGMIYVPVDIDLLKVRIGAAVHTPTFFSMTDEWSSKMSSSFDNGDSYSNDSPAGTFDYQLTTPMKAIGSIALQFAKIGTLSCDYEILDYSEARLRSDSYKYFDENEVISSKYTAAQNLRFGGELAFGNYRLRGGYAIYGSPYSSGINSGEKISRSIGFGVIDEKYFMDFSYVYSATNEDYYLYNYTGENPVYTKQTSHNFLITMGLKF
jgi:hypothetical protein